MHKQNDTYRIKTLDGEETLPTIIEALGKEGHTVTRLSLTKPTLDEVYLEYTGRSMREREEAKENIFTQRMTMRRARGR